MRKPLMLAGLLLATSASASENWSGLWRTDDQRGEQLLRRGDAAAAARTYADPRRKAYAELQSGDYPAAARAFGTFDDSDAHYNRGNALAHSGDLQEALKAYDTALARNPDNQDARHNRDLVAQALKQQQQQKDQQSKDGQQKDGQKKDEQQKDSRQSGQQQQQQGSSGQAQPQSGQDQQQNASSQAQADQKSAGARQDRSQDQKSGKAPDQQQAQQSQQAPAQQTQQGAAQDQQQAADDAKQAQRDAAAGLKQTDDKQARDKQLEDGQAVAGSPDKTGNAARAEADAVTLPRSEQQLSQDQWLRRIPDDPGGLLRRKFMIEHLMRQQNQQQDQQP